MPWLLDPGDRFSHGEVGNVARFADELMIAMEGVREFRTRQPVPMIERSDGTRQ